MDLQRIELKVMNITPETAHEFLTHNISNRKMDERMVRLYTRLLQEGKFIISNDAICFDQSGTLLNGQHRLAAACRSGISFPCIVARNVPTEAYIIMDNGKNRTAADVLYTQGVKSAALVAAAIKRYMLLCANSTITTEVSGSGGKVANAETESEFNNNYNFWSQIVPWGRQLNKKSRWKLMKASDIIAFTAYLVREKNHPLQRAQDFFDMLEGVKDPSVSVIVQLQQRLNDSKRNPMRQLLPFVRQKLVIKARNAYCTGKEYHNFFYNEKSDKDLWFV